MTTSHPLTIGPEGNHWVEHTVAPPTGSGPETVRRQSILNRWPVWAQNTVIIVGSAAVLVVVFFAGFLTASNTLGSHPTGIGSGMSSNQQFGSGQSGSGFGSQSGSSSEFGSGSGFGSSSGFGSGTLGNNSSQGTGTGLGAGSNS